MSFQRSTGKGDPSDNIYNGLKPFDENGMQAIILWQSTGGNDTNKQWLAVKQVSDVNLSSSTQAITEAESDWPVTGSERKESKSINISPVPEIPCDYQKLKLKWSTDCPSLALSINDGFWQHIDENQFDISAYAGVSSFGIKFGIGTEANLCNINHIEIVADAFDVSNATLLARFKESPAIAFKNGVGPDSITDGDRIFGVSSGASAIVYGSPIVSSGNWTNGNSASGTILIDDVNGTFDVGGQEQIAVNGKSVVVDCTSYSAMEHFIKAYYGTESGCGTPNTDPLDGEKGPNPIDPAALNWPPDEGDPLTEEKDNFTLIQWDVVNSGAIGIDSKQTVVQIDNPLTTTGSTLGLHTFGNGSLNVYFDDFGYQTFVDQPVAISQPIQY